MCSAPCCAAWRLAALLLGASWVVTLAVACGGRGDNDDDNPATATRGVSDSTSAASRGAPAEAGAKAVAAVAVRVPGGLPGLVPGQGATSLTAPPPSPCSDELRWPAQLAALHAPARVPVAQDDGPGGEALNSPAGHPGASVSGAAPPVDPFEAK